jgi:autotransporter-associated beta strand protein
MGMLGQAAHEKLPVCRGAIQDVWLCGGVPPRWPVWGSTNECNFAALHRGTIVGTATLLFTAVLVLPPTSARAQTWTGPGTDYNTAANWTPNTIPATLANTGTFSGTVAPSTVNISATVTPGGFLFAPGAQSYTITTTSGAGLAFLGVGITNNSSNAQNLVASNGTAIQFQGNSTAGNATLTANNGGFIQFFDTSSGGAARVTTNGSGAMVVQLASGGLSIGSLAGSSGSVLFSSQNGGAFTQSLTIGNLNTSTTYGGIISDVDAAGSITKIGTGTLTLTATNTFTGPTTINAGTLEVDGSIANSSNVTVNPGGTLSGIGTVDLATTTIMGRGTLAPGNAANPTGTLTITGNLVFQSGALYLVQVTPAQAASTNVSGTATLTGATVQANFASGNYVPKQYTILTAAGGMSGTFSGISNSSLPANATDSLSYSANAVFLNLAPGFTTFTGLNQNQQNVANTLTNFFNATGGIPAQFFGLTPRGLTQVSGEAATGAERAVFQMTNEFLNLMLDPFVSGRANVGGLGVGAIGFAPEEQTLPPEVALAYASILNKEPPKPVFEQGWTAWGGAYGGSNRANGDPVIGSNNITAQAFGFAAGMVYHLSPYNVFGFALAGGGTNWGLANVLGSGRSDAFQAGTYGMSWFGPAYVAGALAFTNHWFTTNRSALGDQLTANFDGQSYGGRVEAGYRYMALPTLALTPYGAVQAQDFHTPAYNESDPAGFGLSYAAMNATDVRTELGARFDNPTLLYGKPLILFGRLAWAHDFVSNPALGAAFQSLPGESFTVNGAPIPQNSALISAGAELFLASNWSLLAKFDGEFGNRSQTYAGSGVVRYMW